MGIKIDNRERIVIVFRWGWEFKSNRDRQLDPYVRPEAAVICGETESVIIVATFTTIQPHTQGIHKTDCEEKRDVINKKKG